MARGEFLAANLMISMLPEEPMVDHAIEVLENYKIGITKEPPMVELMTLLMKWKSKGKSSEEIVKDISKVEEAKEYIDRRESLSN